MTLNTEQITKIGNILNDVRQPLKARFRALFALRNIGSSHCVELISKCFDDSSALLKHELAYCLGQTQNEDAIPMLKVVLEDENQETIVRHEAAEAMGAIGNPSVIPLLKKYAASDNQPIAETCQLALRRIDWAQNHKHSEEPSVENSIFESIDPAPASPETNVNKLAQILTDPKESLWNRYRAMFSLRNINSEESIKALAKGLCCDDSALFRHEVAYVLGQTQSPHAIEELRDRLQMPEENYMVRHECAEALGAIATEECTVTLQKYVKDSDRVVRESCEVALDMADYENSDSFQYTTVF